MRTIKTWLAAMIALSCSLTASAEIVQVDGIWYDLVKKIAKVTQSGDDTNSKYSGSVAIPSEVIYDGAAYRVASIGNKAFRNCSGLASITIPESVTSIEDEAFYGCSGLTSITIPESVTSIGEKSFAYCSSLVSIVIPNSVAKIGLEAFAYCSGLTSIIMIPESLTSFGRRAFLECTGELFFCCDYFNTRDPVDYYNSPFYGSEFSKVVIGDNVTHIPSFAFYGCSSLTSITIPESVTYIGTSSFYGCSNLTEVYINSIEAWCEMGGSNSLCCAYNLYLNGELVTELVIPKGVTSIGNYAFHNCSSLTAVTIPESVTDIGESAFKNCYNLASITILEGVTDIGWSTFYGCSSLTFIAIPEGVTRIEADVFNECSKLAAIVLPKSLEYMNYRVLANCEELLDVYCYAETAPIAYDETFEKSYPEGMILHVPANAVGNYRTTAPWSSFGVIESLGTAISNLAICESSVTLMEEETLTLNITTTPSNADKNLIAWSSSNPNVASVDANGKVLAVSPGTATITAKAYDGSKLSASCEVEVVAAPRYAITFILDGEIFYTDTLIGGKKIKMPEAPEREGYTFSGWGEVPEFMPTNDLVVNGTFTVNKYLVTFKIGDEIITSDSLEYGTVIILPEEPVKEGHTFCGWSEIPEMMPAGDVIVNGRFVTNKYLVTFKVDGEVIASDSLEYGSRIIIPAIPDPIGYTFNGWNEVDETVPARDVTYEGVYTANIYKVCYYVYVDDGPEPELVHTAEVVYGTPIVLPEAPIKEGYTFSGWSESPEMMPAYDVTVSGTFIINKYLVTLKVGDEVVAFDYLEYGTPINFVFPVAPEKEGYTFNGWGEMDETVPAHDVVYEGTYTVNTYKVYYYLGVELEPVHIAEVAYGDTISLFSLPNKEGYTFSGWSAVPETMPAEDVFINGAFIPNVYKLYCYVDEELVHIVELMYGEYIPQYIPTKEGHTFSGWSEAPETMPTEDVTIYGTFTANVYKVYYYVGEALVHTAEVTYGETIPEYIYEPTNEGDEFIGWVGGIYATMPAHDVTYTANIVNGIDAMSTDNSQLTTVIYDLSGRRIVVDDLRELQEGIYLINGRKVVIK